MELLQSENGFQRKVPLFIDTGNFVIKTVEALDELYDVLKLRHEVFHREFRKVQHPTGLDLDQYDLLCDHLVIRDQVKNRLVGTYRLISSTFSKRFYSEEEFNLGGLLAAPGVKLELGRACIDKSYRGGVVMTLLWRGLAQYLKEIQADFLFGCSSAKTTDSTEISAITGYLRQNGFITDEFNISPRESFTVPPSQGEAPGEDRIKELVPSLLSSYLRAGAKVCGEPALDMDFKCADYFTVLRTQNLTQMFDRKYQVS